MSVEAVIATQVIDTTSVGRSIMTAADAAAVRTAADAQVTLVSGTNIKTINSTSLLGSGDIAVGVSGTGSVDNAALRADGTGGATLQNSAWIINDNLTASPNNTVNHACLEATGGTTNVSVSIKPKGAGAFCLSAPDGTSTGGNVRGANAVDLQTSRSTAAQVASGASSVAAGVNSTASGAGSIALGRGATASGGAAIAIGDDVNGTGSSATGTRGSVALAGGSATGQYEAVAIGYDSTASGGNTSLAIGNSCTASGNFSSIAIGNGCTASGNISQAIGNQSLSDRYGMRSRSVGRFAAQGDSQEVGFLLRNKTTNNTATTLFTDGSSARLTIPSGKVMSAVCRICGIKSDGSAVANYVRSVVIKNVGGTTALVGSAETIGTDIEDNASTDVAITADNTNDALQINVTGITGETWRWVAVVEGLEIAYGT
jgi:hypothetical protein